MSDETTFCPDCCAERGAWTTGTVPCRQHEITRAVRYACSVLSDLNESATYCWSDYDVPVGMVDRIRTAHRGLVALNLGGGR